MVGGRKREDHCYVTDCSMVHGLDLHVIIRMVCPIPFVAGCSSNRALYSYGPSSIQYQYVHMMHLASLMTRGKTGTVSPPSFLRF